MTGITAADIPFSSDTQEVERSAEAVNWPAPLRQAAYHGVIGDMVRALAPHTEADPAALLVQILVMFGSVIGRGAYLRCGGRHSPPQPLRRDRRGNIEGAQRGQPWRSATPVRAQSILTGFASATRQACRQARG